MWGGQEQTQRAGLSDAFATTHSCCKPVMQSCRCALQLLLDSSADFLRRVSIICMEDALLHPSLPVLVWLMCAQAKGYMLGKDAAMLCLHIVHQLASVPVRDQMPRVSPLPENTGERLLGPNTCKHMQAGLLKLWSSFSLTCWSRHTGVLAPHATLHA